MENTIEVEESKGKNKGFTLIELLIVIVILGILAAVTVFAVRGITNKGQTSACEADKKTLETAVESYFAQYGGTVILTGAAPAVGPPAVAGTPLPGSNPVVYAAPTVQGTLVNAGYLRAPSTKYDITLANADGKILTATDPACT